MRKIIIVILFIIFIVSGVELPGNFLFAPEPRLTESSIQKELEFAEKLVDKYQLPVSYEIADQICEKIIKNNPSKDMAVMVELARAKIKGKKVYLSRITPEERKAYFDDAIKAQKEVVTSYKDNPRVIEIKFSLGELLRAKGDFMVNLLRKEERPTQKELLKTEIEALFNETTEYFKILVNAYQEEINKIDAQIQEEYMKPQLDQRKVDALQEKRKELDSSLSMAEYYLPKTMYNFALMYEEGSKSRIEKLKEAAKMFDDFMLKLGTNNWSYQAANEKAKCYIELGEYEGALGALEISTTDLIRFLDINNVEEQDRESVRDIILEGYMLKIRTFNRMGDYKQSTQVQKEMLSKVKDVIKRLASDDYAQSAFLEYADTLAGLKDFDGALKACKDVMKLRGSRAGDARDKLQDIIRKIGPSGMSAEMFFENVIIYNYYETKDMDEAIKQARLFLPALKRADLNIQQKFIPQVLWFLGNAYLQKTPKRYYEALIAFEELYKNYEKAVLLGDENDKLMPKAANNASMCYKAIENYGKDAAYKSFYAKKYNDVREYMIKKGIAGELETAEKYFNDKEYIKAAEAYKKVPKTSKSYIDAQSKIGFSYYLQANRNIWPAYEKEADETQKKKLSDEAVKILSLAETSYKDFLKFIEESLKKPKLEDNEKRKLKFYEPRITVNLARVYFHPALKKYNEVLTVLDGFETKYARDAASELPDVFKYKVEAYLKSNNLDKAEAYLENLTKIASRQKLPPPTNSMVSIAEEYEKKAEEIVSPDMDINARQKAIEVMKTGDKKKYALYEGYVGKYIKYYLDWLSGSAPEAVTAENVIAIADRVFKAALDIEKEDFYRTAGTLYEQIINKKYGTKMPVNMEPWKLKWKLAKCFKKIGEWEKTLALLKEIEIECNDVGYLGGIKKDLAVAFEENKLWSEAIGKWGELAKNVKGDSEDYWEARYRIIGCQMQLGAGGGYQSAWDGLRLIEVMTNGEYDGNKYGYKDKFIKLKEELEKVRPK